MALETEERGLERWELLARRLRDSDLHGVSRLWPDSDGLWLQFPAGGMVFLKEEPGTDRLLLRVARLGAPGWRQESSGQGATVLGAVSRVDLERELGLSSAARPAEARVETGPILAKRYHESGGVAQCFLTVQAPSLAARVRAGQFANLRANDLRPSFLPGYRVVESWSELRGSPNGDPEALHLSRLPMSVQRAFGPETSAWCPLSSASAALAQLPRLFRHLLRRSDCDRVEFGFKVVGHGTRALARKEVGDPVDLLGPLGQEAPLPLAYRRVLLVAGGIGLTALSLLAERLRVRGDDVTLLVGARDREQLFPDPEAPDRLIAPEFQALGVEVEPVTEQGDGRYVTDRLAEVLRDSQRPRYDAVYSCGPWPMMSKVAALCRDAQMPCWVLLEQRMECGVGVCMSCVCRTWRQESPGEWTHTRVCQEGPTFNALRVNWG